MSATLEKIHRAKKPRTAGNARQSANERKARYTHMILKIQHQEDLEMLVKLAKELQLRYVIEKVKKKKKSQPAKKSTSQLKIFKQMENLRMKLRAIPAPADLDISRLANEVNAL